MLALLDERPMYPYRMQQLIRERGKDEIVNVRHRTSLYQTIARLERDRLIEVQGTSKAENRPERTVYQITRDGRQTIQTWLREMLAKPAGEFPEFPAALSFLYLLEVKVARKELMQRAESLQAKLERWSEVLREHAGSVPRLFLLEVEYLRAVTQADLAFVQGIIEDLERGRLSWDRKALARTLKAAE
ncbi:MAG: helix-turn-helix transcriptional regulator [Gemmatimonadaceae bacterium]